MKNQYLFFCTQSFEGLDLSNYRKKDIPIPKTDICIYEFECSDDALSEDESAEKLDWLSQQLEDKYTNLFQIVQSESSQYYCRQLYPMVVDFETKLRYALYISRALFENGNISKDSFLYETDKKAKKSVEEMDFGIIYEVFFTDKTLKTRLYQEYSNHLTKADVLRIVNRMEEKTIWSDCVGNRYDYIYNHFSDIKNYRNHVMHNHLISKTIFENAKNVFVQANKELERAIDDKLIVNDSQFLNAFDIFHMLLERVASQQIELVAEQTPRSIDLIKNAIEALAIKTVDLHTISDLGLDSENEISQIQKEQRDVP